MVLLVLVLLVASWFPGTTGSFFKHIFSLHIASFCFVYVSFRIASLFIVLFRMVSLLICFVSHTKMAVSLFSLNEFRFEAKFGDSLSGTRKAKY